MVSLSKPTSIFSHVASFTACSSSLPPKMSKMDFQNNRNICVWGIVICSSHRSFIVAVIIKSTKVGFKSTMSVSTEKR